MEKLIKMHNFQAKATSNGFNSQEIMPSTHTKLSTLILENEDSILIFRIIS